MAQGDTLFPWFRDFLFEQCPAFLDLSAPQFFMSKDQAEGEWLDPIIPSIEFNLIHSSPHSSPFFRPVPNFVSGNILLVITTGRAKVKSLLSSTPAHAGIQSNNCLQAHCHLPHSEPWHSKHSEGIGSTQFIVKSQLWKTRQQTIWSMNSSKKQMATTKHIPLVSSMLLSLEQEPLHTSEI